MPLLVYVGSSKMDLDHIFPSRDKNIFQILPNVTSSLHHLIELAFNVQLWVFGLHTFQLDGYLLTGGNVCT